jgi:hypothetical protein
VGPRAGLDADGRFAVKSSLFHVAVTVHIVSVEEVMVWFALGGRGA